MNSSIHVDCEAIRTLIALKLGRLFNFLSRNAFCKRVIHLHLCGKIPIEVGLPLTIS